MLMTPQLAAVIAQAQRGVSVQATSLTRAAVTQMVQPAPMMVAMPAAQPAPAQLMINARTLKPMLVQSAAPAGPCTGVICPPGLTCKDGGCVDASCIGVICPPGYVCTGGACQPTPETQAAQAQAQADAVAAARQAENDAAAAQAAAARNHPATPPPPATIPTEVRLPASTLARQAAAAQAVAPSPIAPEIKAAIAAQRQAAPSDPAVPGMVRTDVQVGPSTIAPQQTDQPVRYIRAPLAPIDPGSAAPPPIQAVPPPDVQISPGPQDQPQPQGQGSGIGWLLALAAGAYFLTR